MEGPDKNKENLIGGQDWKVIGSKGGASVGTAY